MLRKIRIALALLFWIGITLLFLDFTGTVHLWLGWMAKIQFLPAVMALNFIVVIFLVALTLIFGRVYCSVICPLGVMQDAVARLGRMGRRNKNKYGYSPALSLLRYGFLALLAVSVILENRVACRVTCTLQHLRAHSVSSCGTRIFMGQQSPCRLGREDG